MYVIDTYINNSNNQKQKRDNKEPSEASMKCLEYNSTDTADSRSTREEMFYPLR